MWKNVNIEHWTDNYCFHNNRPEWENCVALIKEMCFMSQKSCSSLFCVQELLSVWKCGREWIERTIKWTFLYNFCWGKHAPFAVTLVAAWRTGVPWRISPVKIDTLASKRFFVGVCQLRSGMWASKINVPHFAFTIQYNAFVLEDHLIKCFGQLICLLSLLDNELLVWNAFGIWQMGKPHFASKKCFTFLPSHLLTAVVWV